jgi:LPXTG-motif cell wall-anchored protein
MRNRLMIATVALLMLVPAHAFADEVEGDAYSDPVPEEGVLDETEEVEEDAVEEEVEEADIEAVTAEEEPAGAVLAVTGVSATMFSLLAALLLGSGALLLVISRRRRSSV